MPQKSAFTGKYVKADMPVNEKIVSHIDGAIFQDEAYHIHITSKGVNIEATTQCGLYWARQTMAQLKTDKKGKNFLQFSAFSAEKVNDGFEYLWVRFLGFDREREEWLQPQTGIEAKGELELSVYNDKLNIACKVSEMSEYVKQPYNPNN